MKMLRWSGMIVVVIGMLAAMPVYGQATEHEKHHPEAVQEKAEFAKAMPMGKMMERCKMMENGMQQMRQRMQKMDSKLQDLVDEMNTSTGEAKISAIAAAVNEMATHRRHMHQAQNEMHGKMMAHMMEHMAQGTKEEAGSQMIMQCPMMKMMGGGAGKPSEGSDSKEHESHHPEEQ